MKKHLIYTGMFLAAIGFSACNEDFKDWADPQSNPQEESAGQLTATFAAGKDASIIMDATTADSVEIAKLSSTTAEESSKIAVNSLTLNENHTIPFTMTEDNAFKVALSQLDSVTQEAYKSRASVERELKIAINTSAVTPSGEGIQLVISTDHLYFVHRKQTDRTTRNVNPTFSPKNGDYMHSILLTQIQFKQGFSGPSRLSRYFKISQMQVS